MWWVVTARAGAEPALLPAWPSEVIALTSWVFVWAEPTLRVHHGVTQGVREFRAALGNACDEHPLLLHRQRRLVRLLVPAGLPAAPCFSVGLGAGKGSAWCCCLGSCCGRQPIPRALEIYGHRKILSD